ncbi:unnamed protein product [Nyctereutes procyonoides]|uniref:Low molecular weight phosphotyrosine protein phosphatase n=1 Tax=Nyctereutes procyonoides TaxID=34880 RepID=A0A811Z898_NYCPR|nr:unnamed protein product [Nyctereutes procyonoides]
MTKTVLHMCTALCREPDAELDPRTPGSCPEMILSSRHRACTGTNSPVLKRSHACVPKHTQANYSKDLTRKSNQIKNCRAKIELLGSYDPQNQLIIEDPYYGNELDLEAVYQQCTRCCWAFLEKVR